MNALTRIASDDDGGVAFDSKVRFRAIKGVTYSIAVDGVDDEQGAVVLNRTLSLTTPPNDNFSRARELLGAAGSVFGSNLAATKQAGEPDHAAEEGRTSIWYRWRAPDNGTATFDTIGSDFDTLLAVYTGTRVDALRREASNDDGTDAISSIVTFEAKRGQTYFIAVDGYDGDEGSVVLNWILGSAGGNAIRWARPVNGNWNNPNNWKPADGRKRVPGPGDLAIIDVPGTYTVRLDVDATVAGLNLGVATGRQTLAIPGHTLTLNGKSVVHPNAIIELGGGALTCNSDFFIESLFRWTGGQLRGEGTLHIENKARLSIEGPANKFLFINRLRNLGTSGWSGGGDIIAGNGALLLSSGTFSIVNNAALKWDGIGKSPTIFNYGTIIKSKSIGVTLFSEVQLANQERGIVQTGILRLRGGGTSYGNFDLAKNTRLEFTSAYFFAKDASSFSGEGDAILIDGTFTIDTSDTPIKVSNFSLDNGVLLGANEQSTLDAEDFTWTGGGMRGKGSTDVSGDLAIGGQGNKTLAGLSLRNDGKADWTGSGDIVGSDGALFDNNGTLNTDDEVDLTYDSGDVPVFNNDGTLNPGDAEEGAGQNTIAQSTLGEGKIGPRALIGLPTGLFNLFGTYNQASSGILNMDIGGTTPGNSYDQVNVNGTANLNGTLNVKLRNGFVPKAGDTFRVFSYSTHNGQFNVNLANLPAGLTVEPIYTDSGLDLRVAGGAPTPTPTPVPSAQLSSIAGTIVTLQGLPLSSVRVERRSETGQTATTETDANGDYLFSDVNAGTYTLTPRLNGREFNPPSRTISLGDGVKLTGADFIALRAPSISGRLTDSSGAGVGGVTIRRSSEGGASFTTTSDRNGYYGFESLPAGTYGIVPARDNMLFNPPFVAVTVSSTTGVGNANFFGTPFNALIARRPNSPLRLSAATISAAKVLLSFTGELDAGEATDAAHYQVTGNGQPIEIESLIYKAATRSVSLSLPSGSVRRGDAIIVQWNLHDRAGKVLSGRTEVLRARNEPQKPSVMPNQTVTSRKSGAANCLPILLALLATLSVTALAASPRWPRHRAGRVTALAASPRWPRRRCNCKRAPRISARCARSPRGQRERRPND